MRISRLVLGLLVTTLAALPAQGDKPSPGDAKTGPVMPDQIQADWLQQDVVRNLPPAAPYNAKTASSPMTTRLDAAGAVDGVKNGRFGFHTERDESPWWQVDLGGPVDVDRVVVFNRCDGNVEKRAARLKVLLSGKGISWTEIYQHDGTGFFGQTDGKPLTVPAAGQRARFVRLALPSAEYFHLDEVEVYAVGGDANVALNKPTDQSSVSAWSKATEPLDAGRDPAVVPEEERSYPVAEVVERGLKLAENLRRLGVDVEADAATLREVARRLKELPDDAPASARGPLYFEARWAVRRMALANPRLDFDDLLFVKRAPGTFTHMSDQYYGWWSRPGGGLYVLEDFKSDDPKVRCLTSALPEGSVLRPDLSYDGTKVVFAYCKHYPELRGEPDKLDKSNVPEDAFYHVFEMNLDGTGLRRLTDGRYDDFDARYLPDGRIVFLSTRRGHHVQVRPESAGASAAGQLPDCYVRCGGGPERPVAVYTLHVMNTDGSGLEQISPFEMFEWTPSIDQQGRILYARWDYVDRHNMPYMSLWSTMPDGTNARAVFGNFTTNPHCMFEARSIPHSQKLIFTASGHHAFTGGSLVLLDPNRSADGEAAMRRLTPVERQLLFRSGDN